MQKSRLDMRELDCQITRRLGTFWSWQKKWNESGKGKERKKSIMEDEQPVDLLPGKEKEVSVVKEMRSEDDWD